MMAIKAETEDEKEIKSKIIKLCKSTMKKK